MKKLFYFILTIALCAILFIGAELLLREYPEIRNEVDGLLDQITAFFDEKVAAVTEKEKPTVDIDGPYQVVRVVDGDTLIVDIDGTQTRVRLIGVDTPESVSPQSEENTVQGKTASEYTKTIFENQSYVFLGYDVQRLDDYGRTLAYVFLDRGKTMLQEKLLEAGMARTMTIQPNSLFADYFYSVMVKARKEKAGFWAEDFWGDSP